MKIFKLIVLLAMAGGCLKNETSEPAAAAGETVIAIDLADRKQIVHNFGASDAWACNYIGQWPDEKRNQVADWFFSTEVDAHGNPKGIGLSLWRFNVGAGSAAQTNIGDEWRRAEGFLKDDGTYDWSKQAGQQWLLRSAKEHGVDQFVAFSNSPPVQLTRNGKAFSGDGEYANIDKKNYVAFAKFLSEVVQHFESQGITFNYLSPFNEPQWSWNEGNQEGSPYTNKEMYDVVTKLDSVIIADHLPSKIQMTEAGAMNYLYEAGDKPTRGNQIESFFVKTSPYYLGDKPSVDKVISAHSYFTSAPMDVMRSVRERMDEKRKTASVPLEFWQTEYCILGDKEEIPGAGKDRGITTALYVARLIHHDLTVGNASAWHWWTSVSVYDYKDGLIYATRNTVNGTVEDTKLLWALGNYSRFVRPGSVRVQVSSADAALNNPKGLMVSAYVDEAGSKLVTVIVNYSDLDTDIRIQVKNKPVTAFQPYRTSGKEGENLKRLEPVDGNDLITISKKSITTLVGELP